MARSSMNLQDGFLNEVRKDGTAITVVLLDGTVLAGTVSGFDSFTVVLETGDEQHLVYKHAVARITQPRSAAFEARRAAARAGGNGSRNGHEDGRENGHAYRSGNGAAEGNGAGAGHAHRGQDLAAAAENRPGAQRKNGKSGAGKPENGSGNGNHPGGEPDRFNSIDLTVLSLGEKDRSGAPR